MEPSLETSWHAALLLTDPDLEPLIYAGYRSGYFSLGEIYHTPSLGGVSLASIPPYVLAESLHDSTPRARRELASRMLTTALKGTEIEISALVISPHSSIPKILREDEILVEFRNFVRSESFRRSTTAKGVVTIYVEFPPPLYSLILHPVFYHCVLEMLHMTVGLQISTRYFVEVREDLMALMLAQYLTTRGMPREDASLLIDVLEGISEDVRQQLLVWLARLPLRRRWVRWLINYAGFGVKASQSALKIKLLYGDQVAILARLLGTTPRELSQAVNKARDFLDLNLVGDYVLSLMRGGGQPPR